MRLNNKGWIRTGIWTGGLSCLVAACGGGDGGRLPPAGGPYPIGQGAALSAPAASDDPVKIGPPYAVNGVTYTPDDAVGYDEVGYAGWYGDERAGSDTASGEPFVPGGVTAAHRTLPLPSYVEVTALDTGRTIVVRVNDRGPFANNRIIDLSRGAAEQLGLIGSGAAAVRVRRVSPPEQERAVLRAHGRAAERLETPPSLLRALRDRLGARPAALVTALPRPPRGKPVPKAPKVSAKPPVRQRAPMPAPGPDGFVIEQAGASYDRPAVARPPAAAPPPRAAGDYIVQVAAFAARSRAETLARRIGAAAVAAGGVWRVRYGPYPSPDAAQAGVRAAAAKGFENARIMANDAP